ncbi:MAG: glycosyltransferase [Candidatus Ancillula sp.]|jgi:glycosyltransferase involved in cell wall biosynthesis|nr:glycosyltransferase [Candidatus Ancillula sp.]
MSKGLISFIGNNFYGIGGAETSMFAVAEEFVRLGYEVEMVSLKQTSERVFPQGIKPLRFYDNRFLSRGDRIKRDLFKSRHWFYYMKDSNILGKTCIPYVGIGLKRYLKKTKAQTVISCVDEVHPFLYKSKNKHIKNKFYYFHGFGSYYLKLDEFYKKEMSKITPENALFVTEKIYEESKPYHKDNFLKHEIVGNTIARENILERSQIGDSLQDTKTKTDLSKTVLQGVVLTRISDDRWDGLMNLLKFGEFIRSEQQRKEELQIPYQKIIIKVFGEANRTDDFIREIDERDLQDVIKYCGRTDSSVAEIRNSDFVLDPAVEQSFGMVYLEAVFNGKMVFATKNSGSLEVLKDIPESFFNSSSDLYEKIMNLSKITREQLQKNYDLLYSRFSPEIVTEKLLKIME